MLNFLKSKSRTFFVYCFSFLFSVALVSIFDFEISLLYLFTIFFVSIFFIILFWKNLLIRFVFLCLLFFLFGLLRYFLYLPKNNKETLIYYNNKTVLVEGFVSVEPDIRLDGVRYIVSSQFLSDSKNDNLEYSKQRVSGNFYFKSTLYPRYNYGDKLRLKCFLKKPEPVEDFRYDKYLARYGVFVDCSPNKIEKIGENYGNIFLNKIFATKIVIASRINKIWHEPYASFMAGLLYGYRGGLGTLNDLFSRTGVTHIVAISGYNITIISTILIAFFTQLYIPRKKAFWLIISGIFVFVIFAGASASVVRAGIMGVLVLLSKQIGRRANIANIMIMTVSIMTLLNPYVLIWDVGFQLSFISTLGLIYLVPVITKYFNWVPEKFSLRDSLVTTLAAIIATLPLILYQFNRLSIVAPIVNILILWILPWIMFAGFIVLVLSFVFMPLAQVFAWLAFVAMKYIVVVVTFFAKFSFSTIDLTFPMWLMFLLYLFIIHIVYKNLKNKKI